jgi:hypothetical protein
MAAAAPGAARASAGAISAAGLLSQAGDRQRQRHDDGAGKKKDFLEHDFGPVSALGEHHVMVTRD